MELHCSYLKTQVRIIYSINNVFQLHFNLIISVKFIRLICTVKNFVLNLTYFTSQFIHSSFNVNLTKGTYVNK